MARWAVMVLATTARLQLLTRTPVARLAVTIDAPRLDVVTLDVSRLALRTLTAERIRLVTLAAPTEAPAGGDALLLESGDYLLLESGDRILLEV